MKNPPKRRGRPPKVQTEAKVQTEVAVRRPRGAVSGAGKLKLYAPEREGYRRRFVNDIGNRLAEMKALGYSFVEAEGIATHGPGTRINRLAGTQEGGSPLKAYLMETPDELWQQGVDEKEEERAGFDQAINQGRDPSEEVDPARSYRPGETLHSKITVERD